MSAEDDVVIALPPWTRHLAHQCIDEAQAILGVRPHLSPRPDGWCAICVPAGVAEPGERRAAARALMGTVARSMSPRRTSPGQNFAPPGGAR